MPLNATFGALGLLGIVGVVTDIRDWLRERRNVRGAESRNEGEEKT